MCNFTSFLFSTLTLICLIVLINAKRLPRAFLLDSYEPQTINLRVMENPKLLFGDISVPGNYKVKSDLVTMRNALKFDDWLWPKGIIPVEIDKKLGE